MLPLAHLLRLVASFAEAGVPPLVALELIAVDTCDRALARSARAVRAPLSRGGTLWFTLGCGFLAATALDHDPSVLEAPALARVRAAEERGDLAQAFAIAAHHVGRAAAVRAEARRAIGDPVSWALVGLAVALAVVGTVSPQLRSLYSSWNIELFDPTRFVLEVGARVSQEYGWVFVAYMLAIRSSIAGLFARRAPRSSGDSELDDALAAIAERAEIRRLRHLAPRVGACAVLGLALVVGCGFGALLTPFAMTHHCLCAH